MIFEGSLISLTGSYFTGELRLGESKFELGLGGGGGVLNLGSLNLPLHRLGYVFTNSIITFSRESCVSHVEEK